VKQLITQTVTE